LVATHPLWQHLSDTVPGDVGDPVLNTYILAWDTHALVTDPLNVFNANIFYPLPNTLAYSENLIGDAIIALPIALLTGEPVLAYNFTFLLSFVLAGFGMYLFMLRVTRQPLAAFVAGVAFAFAPYRIASLAHIQLLTVQWLPLVAYGAWRMADSKSPRSSLVILRLRSGQARRSSLALMLIFLWLQIASSLHGALFAALIVGVFLVISSITYYVSPFTLHAPRFTLHASPLSLISLISFISLTTLLTLPYLSVFSDLRAARPPETTLSFLATPSDFLAAYPWSRIFGAVTDVFRQRDGFTEEHTLFMGVVVAALALVGIGKTLHTKMSLRGVPQLYRGTTKQSPLSSQEIASPAMRLQARNDVFTGGGWVVRWFGGLLLAGLLLATSAWLVQLVPLASVMRVPARWGIVITFALAGLCGLGVARLSTATARSTQRKNHRNFALFAPSRFVLVILGIVIFAEGFAAPIPTAPIGTLAGQTGVYHFLAQQPGREAVIELPLFAAPDAEAPEAKRMVASALHWRPLVNGYSGFTPPRQTALAMQLKNFPDDASLAALRVLGRQGVRYVIVHSGEPGIPRRAWVQTNRAKAIESGVLRFVGSFDDNDLFEIVSP
ncbi:MAG: hypothetical protein ABI874_07630, partial [Chloroflexota bacterium]